MLRRDHIDPPILAIFCPYAEILQAFRRLQDPQYQMTDVEVKTSAIPVAMFFRRNSEPTRIRLLDVGYIRGCCVKVDSVVDCIGFKTWWCMKGSPRTLIPSLVPQGWYKNKSQTPELGNR